MHLSTEYHDKHLPNKYHHKIFEKKSKKKNKLECDIHFHYNLHSGRGKYQVGD